METKNLSDMRVIITRQKKFAVELINLIHKHGGSCSLLPLFSIQPLLEGQQLGEINSHLDTATVVVFISRNAAEIILPHFPRNLNAKLATVGPGTANYLYEQGLKPIIYPEVPPFDSESLVKRLRLSGMDFNKQKFVIFSGEGGRAWLQNELLSLGATIKLFEIYKRVACSYETVPEADIILITCATSLENLRVKNKPILVVSERIYQKAIELGFSKVYTSDGMSDAAILAALLKIKVIK